MSTFAIALTVAVLVPIALHLRRVDPARMYGVSGLTYLGFGGIFTLLVLFAPHLLNEIQLSRSEEDRIYHDTYIVIPEFQYFISFGLLLLILAALLYFQQRRGALYLPRLTRWLFWPVIAPLCLPPLLGFVAFNQMPKRHEDFPNYVAAINLQQTIIALASLIAVLVLITLGIASLIKHARQN